VTNDSLLRLVDEDHARIRHYGIHRSLRPRRGHKQRKIAQKNMAVGYRLDLNITVKRCEGDGRGRKSSPILHSGAESTRLNTRAMSRRALKLLRTEQRREYMRSVRITLATHFCSNPIRKSHLLAIRDGSVLVKSKYPYSTPELEHSHFSFRPTSKFAVR
jgi:hypothetical protein